MLKLEDHWIWDSWYAHDGKSHHAFYLKAPRALGDPELRHRNPKIGHAISTDLIHWEELPDALSPSETPSFDSWTTWTGSVVRDDTGIWWLFYTGTCREDGGLIQKVGAATSTDLISWTKLQNNPLTEANKNYYDKLNSDLWQDEAWRDPWVFKYQNKWQMITTARGTTGSLLGRGVAGHASSTDLVNWEIHPPLTNVESGFGQLEVIQTFELDGIPTMLWCCGAAELSPELKLKYPSGGVFSVTGNSILGPFNTAAPVWFPNPDLYAARAIQHDGSWYLIGFVNGVGENFGGYLTDPIPIKISGLGIVPK